MSQLPRANRRNLLKAGLLIVALAALALIFKALPMTRYMGFALQWAGGLGNWGPVVAAAIYVPACVLLIPGSALTLGIGFLFGVVPGMIAVSAGSTLGACCSFLIGRRLARGWTERKMAGNERFAAISVAVARQGFLIVLLTRLSPLFPFNVLNYAFGLTSISFWRYALASWLGMLPGGLLYVYLGAGARSLAEVTAGNVEGGMAGRAFFWFGLLATLGVTMVVTRLARRALQSCVDTEPEVQAILDTEPEVQAILDQEDSR